MRHGFGGFGLRRQCQRLHRQSRYFFASKQKGKLDVAGAVGKNGFVTVIKDLGLKEPYIGKTPIVSGEIAEDITSYYAVSEQIPTVCALGVLTEHDNGEIICAGGFMIQLLPTADDTIIERVEESIKTCRPSQKCFPTV